MERGTMHFTVMKQLVPAVTVNLTVGQAVRRRRRKKEGTFWHYNNPVPTGNALWVIYILEKLPETLRAALGLWICVLLVGNNVTGKFPTRWDHDEGGRGREALGCLPRTSSRQMKWEGR